MRNLDCCEEVDHDFCTHTRRERKIRLNERDLAVNNAESKTRHSLTILIIAKCPIPLFLSQIGLLRWSGVVR